MKKTINIMLLISLFNLITVNNAQSISNNKESSNNSYIPHNFWFYPAGLFWIIGTLSLTVAAGMKEAADENLEEYNRSTHPPDIVASRKLVEEEIRSANGALIIGGVSCVIAGIFSYISYKSAEETEQEYSSPKKEENTTTQGIKLIASELSFYDQNGDGCLDAGERAKISLNITNQGKGTALNLKPILKFSNSNITYDLEKSIKDLEPGESEKISFDISADEKLADGNTSFEIIVYEDNGYNLTPSVKITIPTKRFTPQKFVITVMEIKEKNNNNKIDPLEVIEVTARIKNDGEGVARDVEVYVEKGENVFFAEDSRTYFNLEDINAGEYRDVVFSVYTNYRASDFGIIINIQEQQMGFLIKEKLDLFINKTIK